MINRKGIPMKRTILILTISMSANIHARYINYDRLIEVTAKLKALGRDTTKIEICDKELKQKYSRFLLPRDYNKVYALIQELLITTERKLVNPQETILHVLEMIDDEIKGLINKHGYRQELIALSYRTTQLRTEITRTSRINPLSIAELKRNTQDLLAEAVLTDAVFKSIQKRVKSHLRKIQEKKEKESHAESEPYEETDIKPE